MTDDGAGMGDEPTRIEHEPPSFPSVSGSGGAGSTPAGGPLFSAAGTPDPAARPVQPSTSAVGAPASGGLGSRVRWLVAGLATLLVLVVVGGVLALATPRAGAPSAIAHYVPADTAMYAEVRLDLPGDQHDNLATFMSHFPGFADQASFQQKLDETLNSVLGRTNAGLSWNDDVKPWFGGQIAVFGDLQAAQMSADGSSLADAVASSPDAVIALTVADSAKLQSTIDAQVGGAQVASTDYQGQEIKTLAQPGGTAVSVSYVITDDTLLVASNPDALKAALDVKAGKQPALADDSYFTQQLGALHSDRLATLYYDAGAQMAAAMPLASNSIVPAQCAQMMQDGASLKMVGELRAESDHLAFTVRSQLPSGDSAPPLPNNNQTTLAEAMPSNSVFYLEMRNVGGTAGWLIKNLLSCVSTMQGSGGPLPSALGGLGNLGDPSQLFEQFLGVKPEGYLDFVDDAAVAVTVDGDKVGGGLVATVDDEAVATQRMAKVIGLLNLVSGFGGASSAQITTADVDHNGTKVTEIHILSSEPGGQPLTIQLAVANGRLYLGVDDFVTSALDRSSNDSLASNAHYQKAISSGPADNAGILYVDLNGLVSVAESNMQPAQKADFETNAKPFVDPLHSFVVINRIDGSIVISDGFLYVE